MSESESVRKTDTVPQWKREEVEELVAFLERYDAVGVVGVAGIPSRQLQDMRRELHGQAELRMSRNTLAVRALKTVADGLGQLVSEVSDQVALVGTDDNPFGLYQELEASKTPAPISAGEVAPDDVVIPEGDTGIDPGPFVGELQTVGADARIEGGSIQVLSDSTVLEAGEEVDGDLEGVLGELGIEPKEVGLDLRAVFAEGVLFEPEELDIDIERYRADVESAAAGARNLSVNAEIATERTVPTLLAAASGEAKSVGLRAEVESPGLMDDLVAKADAQVRALAAAVDDEEALPEELRSATAPAAPEPESEAEPDDEQPDEEPAEDADADADDSDEDDGDDGAEGLGEMFG